jgi:hypothetical protein
MNFGESSSIVRDIPSSCLLKTANVQSDLVVKSQAVDIAKVI